MQNRCKIRQNIRQQRLLLTASQQEMHAKKALEHIENHPFFIQSQHMAFYVANQGEIDPEPLMKKALSLGKNCYLPILHPTLQNQLLFMPYHDNEKMIKNRYGILEPPFVSDNIIFPWCIDIIFTPLIAYDDKGNRLGAGKGYYDRTFAFLMDQQRKSSKLIGMAHELQHVSSIKPEPWDIPLSAVLTENNFILFS